MPQKKKSQVRESKPLAETPKSNWKKEYVRFLSKQKKRQAAYDAAQASIKPRDYYEGKRQGKSVIKEKFNRLGRSFTSDM
jgi:hypothetical protein